jgi:hypothetical protein
MKKAWRITFGVLAISLVVISGSIGGFYLGNRQDGALAYYALRAPRSVSENDVEDIVIPESEVQGVSGVGKLVSCHWWNQTFAVSEPQPLIGATYSYRLGKGEAKISEIKKLSYDWDSIAFLFNRLEEIAFAYSGGQKKQDDLDILSLCYELNSVERKETVFAPLCQPSSSNIYGLVDHERASSGLSPQAYFSHYLNKEEVAGYVKEEKANNADSPYAADPNDYQNPKLAYPLMAMLAVADRFAYALPSSSYSKGELLLDSYASWGMSLQKACHWAFKKYQGVLPDDFQFSEVLSHKESGYSLSDLLGQIDGMNLASQGLNNGNSLVESLALIHSYDDSERFEAFLQQGPYAAEGELSLRGVGEKLLHIQEWDYASLQFFHPLKINYHTIESGLTSNPYDFLGTEDDYPTVDFAKAFLSSFIGYLQLKAEK